MSTRLGGTVVGALALLGCGVDREGGEDRPPAAAPMSIPATPEPRAPAVPAWDDVKRRFAAVDVPGFLREVRKGPTGEDDYTFVAKAPNSNGTTFDATVYAGVCESCSPMDVAVWRADPSLNKSTDPRHRENPAMVFDVYELDLSGKKGIAIFKESFLEWTTPGGGRSTSVIQSLEVDVNDGKKRVYVYVHARSPDARSAEALRKRASKADFEVVAKTIFAPYASSF